MNSWSTDAQKKEKNKEMEEEEKEGEEEGEEEKKTYQKRTILLLPRFQKRRAVTPHSG